jgi:hypothetical protein
MSHIRNAAAAAIALAITLTGATFVVAPMALADSRQIVAHVHGWSVAHLPRLEAGVRGSSSSARPA